MTTNKMRVGTQLIKHLSSTFYPNPLIIFDELLSNARDAMATEVKITITDDEIIVEDNGEGMSPEELVKFFYISYSEKPTAPMRQVSKTLVRQVIGKFGIGKLSLYQICEMFHIYTWKGGTASEAEFNFTQFEKKKFIDDVDLSVKVHKTSTHSNGTKLILEGLKTRVDANDLKRKIVRIMPLTRDFKVIFTAGKFKNLVLRSEEVLKGNIQSSHEIDEEVRGIGRIKGRLVYKKHETGQDYGVFIRVFGRLVNLESPRDVINFSDLTHARQFAKKIYFELSVDSLNDALQTNRAGFIKTDPRYVTLCNWLKTTLNRYNSNEHDRWKKAQEEGQDKRAEEYITRDFIPVFKNTLPRISIKLEPLGLRQPEGVFNSSTQKIIINSLHPFFTTARAEGKDWGVWYHSLRVSITLIALESSKTLEEFKDKYNKLVDEFCWEKYTGV